jgi:WhiB family transcriptional regulator, redox-sensing transcriptional regulator
MSERWMESAVCATVDPEVFFPVAKVHTRKAYMQGLRTAQAICTVCPVVADCAGYAIEHGIRYGVWGGLDMEQLPRHVRARWANA